MAADFDKRSRFESCVNRCADSAYRVAFRLLGNEAAAKDLVQETFLQAWANLDSLADPDRMRSWLFGILRNQYTKVLRRESRVTNLDPSDCESVVQAERSENEKELAATVQDAVHALDDKFRLPLLLVSMEGFSVEEAASILELPQGTVLSRLYRAREKLRNALACELAQSG